MVSAGQMRDRVRFERRTEIDDGFGNRRGEWQELFTVSAAIQPMGGSERLIASRLDTVGPVRIRVRWSQDNAVGAGRLTTADRAVNVRFGDIYNIRSIDRDPRRRHLTIIAETGEPS